MVLWWCLAVGLGEGCYDHSSCKGYVGFFYPKHLVCVINSITSIFLGQRQGSRTHMLLSHKVETKNNFVGRHPSCSIVLVTPALLRSSTMVVAQRVIAGASL
jgi:hypothetical protein